MDGTAAIIDGRFLTTALNDPTKQSQIYEYVEALKGDESGWRKSIENIVTNDLRSAEECFIMLQVVEDYVNTRYAMSDESSTLFIKQFLSHLLRKNGEEDIPAFLVNKMAQIFALVFAVDFPDRWPNFMQEVFLGSGMEDTRAIQFYLKTLLAIDSEVVDRDIQRSADVFDRNTKIKDAMRDLCMNDCVRSWHHILKEVTNITTQSLVLDVVAVYVDWIDIELVANEEFVPLLVDRLTHSCTTEPAQRAVCALMGKKMPSLKKITLVSAISKVMNEHNLLVITEKSGEEDELRVANLLSAIGLAVIDSYSKMVKESWTEGKEETLEAMGMLEKEGKTMIRLLGSEDEEVSMSIMELVKSYIGLLMQNQSQEGDVILSQIMDVSLSRYVMGNDLDLDGTGEEESDFHVYRKDLRHVMHAITLKRPELIVEPLELRLKEMEGREVGMKKREATLHLVYSLSELLPNGLLNAKGGWLSRGARLPVIALSHLSPQSSSSSLTLLYFEIVARYEKLVCKDPSVMLSLVPHFIADYGMGNSNPTVRSRVIYLFSRFVKSQRSLLATVVPEVIMRVAPLLASCQDDLSSTLLSHEDQGYLLEATATLIVFSAIEATVKAQYMTELASTIGNRFKKQVEWMGDLETRGQLDDKTRTILEEALPANVSYTIKITKAFGLSGKEKNMAECGCAGVFIDLLNLFTSALSSSRSFLAESTRQLAGRLVLCLEEELFPSLSLLLSSLASLAVDADSMLHLLILTNNIVQKHKGGLLSSTIDVSRILDASCSLSVGSIPSSTLDPTGRSLMYLKRAFLSLVLTLLNTDLLGAVVDADLGSRLFESARHLSIDVDSTTQKTAVSVLSRMVSGGGDEVMERVLSTLLSLPITPHFSFKDAASQLVLHEVRSTIHECYLRRPDLVTSLIASNFPSDFSQQMMSSLTTLSVKTWNRTADRDVPSPAACHYTTEACLPELLEEFLCFALMAPRRIIDLLGAPRSFRKIQRSETS
ncbi:hypothetical protein PMAYCL1PPCAC_18129 [Pristionchus mayeri]|uniref:Exportin-T n=1 Tax=Pristionchus mayeri TaxID=1317129 RepID=A0AAN5CPC1_9BILA|nr:hypothetical protein PMAYCL1PPCAC_18129 [Pristionchus mayeri]